MLALRTLSDGTIITDGEPSVTLAGTNSNTMGIALELNNHYNIRVRSRGGLEYTDYVTLPSGTYDPDSLIGSGQALVDYGEPFHHVLPMLNDTVVLYLESNNQGFVVSIAG